MRWKPSDDLPPTRASGGPLLRRAVLAVAQYLLEAFPGTRVSHRYESRHHLYRYVVSNLGFHLLVSQEFLEDHPPEEVPTRLASWDVAGRLQTAGAQQRMVVTNDGYLAEPGATSGKSIPGP